MIKNYRIKEVINYDKSTFYIQKKIFFIFWFITQLGYYGNPYKSKSFKDINECKKELKKYLNRRKIKIHKI